MELQIVNLMVTSNKKEKNSFVGNGDEPGVQSKSGTVPGKANKLSLLRSGLLCRGWLGIRNYETGRQGWKAKNKQYGIVL